MKFKLIFAFIFCFVAHSQCASYYSKIVNGSREIIKRNLRLDLENEWVATAIFQETLNETGWDLLSVRSNPKLKDEIQMLEAGYIEGYVTQKQIQYYSTNLFQGFCKNKTICDYIHKMVDINTEFIYNMKNEKPNDPVIYQTFLTYEQIRGIHEGYSEAAKENNGTPLNFTDILGLTIMEDLSDIKAFLAHKEDLSDIKAFLAHEDMETIRSQISHCSALIRLLPDFSDIFISHDTWTDYTTMNRMIKKYNFAVHMNNNTENSTLVPSTVSTFSGYPGSVSSVDDFYILSSGIVAIETTNIIFNNQTYGKVQPGSQIFEGIRSVTSNRLAATAKEWVDYFTKFNSGTYNNQWMIVDLKKFKPGVQPKNNLFWLVETVPGYFESRDLTENLVSDFYFASYNLPYFQKINELSGNLYMDNKYSASHEFNHELYARPMIFKREVPKVLDLESMYKLMRLNNYKNDPYSNCSVCKPHQHPYQAIASRGDLFPKSGYAPRPYVNHTLSGATDCKITSWKLFTEGVFVAVSSPTTSGKQLPPFSWSKAGTNVSHLGQPDTWDFPPVLVSLTSKNSSSIQVNIIQNMKVVVIDNNTYILSKSSILTQSSLLLLTILLLQFAFY